MANAARVENTRWADAARAERALAFHEKEDVAVDLERRLWPLMDNALEQEAAAKRDHYAALAAELASFASHTTEQRAAAVRKWDQRRRLRAARTRVA